MPPVLLSDTVHTDSFTAHNNNNNNNNNNNIATKPLTRHLHLFGVDIVMEEQ